MGGGQEAVTQGPQTVLGGGVSREVRVSSPAEARPGWALRMCPQREFRKGRRGHKWNFPGGGGSLWDRRKSGVSRSCGSAAAREATKNRLRRFYFQAWELLVVYSQGMTPGRSLWWVQGGCAGARRRLHLSQ